MTLLFIHGAGCLPRVFEAQLAAFSDAIAVNLPGHGTPGSCTSIAEFADAVAAEMRSRGIDRAILAGSSMGGAIALELALRRDPRVAGLVLLGSSARLRVAPAILEGLADDFPATAVALADAFYADLTPERIAGSVEMMLEVGQTQTLRDFTACDAFDARERVYEIEVPLLALTGEQDRLTPPKFAEFFVGRVPRASARIVPGAGHLVFIERPDETNDAIDSFVTTIS